MRRIRRGALFLLVTQVRLAARLLRIRRGMGVVIEDLPQDSDQEFRKRLRLDLAAAELTLARPGFGAGETTIGAELELSLIDSDGKASLTNREVLAATDDEHFTFELDRFNLEFNADPLSIEGRPFDLLGNAFESAIARVDEAASPVGAQCISIGTLPTLELATLAAVESMTDLPRYRALAVALRSFRRRPFALNIDGLDPLAAECDGVTLEGANTSLQLHLRTPPERFADTYNAAQLATPISLAIAGNSPLFCGHRLWDETRVAVFKQAVDIRAHHDGGRPPRVCFGHGWTRHGIHELLAEAVHLHEPLLPIIDTEREDGVAVAQQGGLPKLSELRLHLGTIWRWNRPILDTGSDGHLRVELRALPSGPTVIDMMANAAFAIGLTLGLRDRIGELIAAIPFEHARTSFYRAAKQGLDAHLFWPASEAPSPEQVNAAELGKRLLPVARQGLVDAGVEAAHANKLLTIIDERLTTRQTGARWQRAALTSLSGPGQPSNEALAKLTLSYLHHAKTNAPVHTWPLP